MTAAGEDEPAEVVTAAGEDGAADESGELHDVLEQPLLAVIAHVRRRLRAGAPRIALRVADPDLGRGRYAGEPIVVDGVARAHRPWRVWIELADRLGLRLRTPRALGGGLLRLELELLAQDARWQRGAPADPRERYGASSEYQRIAKGEEPGFLLDLGEALARCAVPERARVLDLGVNDGAELELMMALAPALRTAELVGVDHSASALALAQARLAGADVRWICADLGRLGEHALGRFDLVVSLGTLQSPGVDDRALLRAVVQDYLTPRGALIVGLPNCRYLDGELVHGARIKNLREPELGLLVRDLAFYRRYLQQHHRRVFVTGHHTMLVTAVPERAARDA
ncbi:MAG: class I SAM-dependent methyltransferase [Kofleriaceae bacterium]